MCNVCEWNAHLCRMTLSCKLFAVFQYAFLLCLKYVVLHMLLVNSYSHSYTFFLFPLQIIGLLRRSMPISRTEFVLVVTLRLVVCLFVKDSSFHCFSLSVSNARDSR